MGQIDSGSDEPYAPLPVSVQPTNVRLGSWFQARPIAIKIAATIGMLIGVVYLSYRLFETSEGVNPWIFWGLYLAEVWGFVTFLMLVYEAWETPPTPRPKPLYIKTAILIATVDEDIDVVEPTIIGALRVRGPTEIWLCDDGKRAEMQELAEHYGINYQTRKDGTNAKAGNINAVLPKLNSDLVFVLDADHVPAPDALEALSGYFKDPKIALVQSAHSFRNHNSVMHSETGRHEQSLFYDVLLPGRNRRGSVFWCGSAALIRLDLLREIGGVATKTSTEDFETSLIFQMKGYKTQYHNEHLIQGLAPDNLASYVTQRGRWAQGTLSAFRPGYALPFRKELSTKQRISYLGALIYYVTPLQRLVYTFYLAMVGLFGVLPVNQVSSLYLVIWFSYIGLTLFAVSALERGSSEPLEGVRNTFLTMEAFLRAIPVLFTKSAPTFKVTPKNEVDMGGFPSLWVIRLPLAIITINLVVVLARWIDYMLIWQIGEGFLPPLTVYASFAVTAFATLEIGVIGILAWRLFNRKQLRRLWRFPVKLKVTSAEGVSIPLVDLHQAGMALLIPTGTDLAPMDIAVEVSDIYGEDKTARGTFYPKNSIQLPTNLDVMRVGGTVVWNDRESKTAVIEHCYVVEPFRARNRQWTRRSPRVTVSMPGEVAGTKATVSDVSIGGVSFVTDGNVDLKVGMVVPVSVTVKTRVIQGKFLIRGTTTTPAGLTRLGGEVEWEFTGWLNEIISMELKAVKNSRSLDRVIRR